MTSLTAAQPAGAPRPSRLQRIAAGSIALVVLADWLFHAHRIGISAILFAVATAVAARAAGARTAGRRDSLTATLLLIVALVPLIEEANVLSLGFAAAGLATFALTTEGRFAGSLTDRITAVVDLYLAGPWRAAGQARRGLRMLPHGGRSVLSLAGLGTWIVPLLLGGVFVMLLSSANPLLDRWLATIDPGALLGRIGVSRIGLWLGIFALTLPLLYVTRRRAADRAAVVLAPDAALGRLRATLLPDAAILRSLVLFNLLFAMQSAMDLAYLWGGVALPDGMSYATYAHRGAYPLIVTALLAAAFVIEAIRPGSSAERNRTIRRLVYLWIAQNVLLVISSILRLDLYVAVYSLTVLRIAAFVWMGLVAIGLALIVIRIALGCSSGWLIRANLTTAMIVLYACSLTNFAAIIAHYNVAHAREISGQGVKLDLPYLYRLGPQAIPAMDRFIDALEPIAELRTSGSQLGPVRLKRGLLASRAELRRDDWRGWSFREERLRRYLATPRGAMPASSSAGQPAPSEP
jgi:hypothetical protein